MYIIIQMLHLYNTNIIMKIKILDIDKMLLQRKLKSYQLAFEFKSPTNICIFFLVKPIFQREII